jgi:hypothetical protein
MPVRDGRQRQSLPEVQWLPAGGASSGMLLRARKLLGWPKRCRLAHAFLWEHSYKRLKLAQLLGQLGVFLTCRADDELCGAESSGVLGRPESGTPYGCTSSSSSYTVDCRPAAPGVGARSAAAAATWEKQVLSARDSSG